MGHRYPIIYSKNAFNLFPVPLETVLDVDLLTITDQCSVYFRDSGVSSSTLLLPQVLSAGRVLSLSSAQISDTGTYTCVAINPGGEQQREYELKVYGEKIIIGLFYFLKYNVSSL